MTCFSLKGKDNPKCRPLKNQFNCMMQSIEDYVKNISNVNNGNIIIIIKFLLLIRPEPWEIE